MFVLAVIVSMTSLIRVNDVMNGNSGMYSKGNYIDTLLGTLLKPEIPG